MGRVVFIGAGPGAVDLMTLRGAQRLAQASVVLCDALTDPGFQALAPEAQWIDVGKRGFCDSMAQATINALLIKHAREVGEAGWVVRLKGGDPSVFARLEEELTALHAMGIDTEVVPGITSALAAAAAIQRPLTRRGRGRSVSLTTAMTHQGPTQVTRRADTEVFYMAGRHLAALSRQLSLAGWPQETPVAVISRAGCTDELHSDHTLCNLAQASVLHAGRPTVVTVGAGATPLTPMSNTAAAETSSRKSCIKAKIVGFFPPNQEFLP